MKIVLALVMASSQLVSIGGPVEPAKVCDLATVAALLEKVAPYFTTSTAIFSVYAVGRSRSQALRDEADEVDRHDALVRDFNSVRACLAKVAK